MRRSGRLVILLAIALGCGRPQAAQSPAPAQARPAGPTVPATVLTVRESSHPPTRAFLHRIVIAGPKVRMGDEKDQWRLFDLEARTVTWVDDVAKTYRTIRLGDLLRARERQLAEPIPAPGAKGVAVRDTGDVAEIAGVPARRFDLEMGGYRREIWISETPLIAPHFLRMLIASEPISEPWAGVMREAQRTLMSQAGFPVRDRSRLAWKGGELLVQRELVKVEKRSVPAAWVTIPPDYKNADVPGAP